MSRSLAFFGAFNPPTRAHIDLAEFALQETGSKDVIFVPSKSTYITEDQKKSFAFSDEDRIDMLKRIADNRSWMRWTDIEMRQSEQPRTYNTLCMLRDLGETPSLLLGADKLEELEHLWRNVNKIAEEFGIVCMDRGDINCESVIQNSPFLTSLNIRVVHVPSAYKNISSSQIRASLLQLYNVQKTLQELLPQELTDLPVNLLEREIINNH